MEATRERTFEPGTGLPGRVWQARPSRPVDLGRRGGRQLPARWPSPGSRELHAAFAFPICLGSEVLGVIEFFSREIRPPGRGPAADVRHHRGPDRRNSIDRRRSEEERGHAAAPSCEQADCRPRTSSWPCSATSCATRWPRCATRPRSCAVRGVSDPAIARIQRDHRRVRSGTWCGWWTTCSTSRGSPAAGSSCGASGWRWRTSSTRAVEAAAAAHRGAEPRAARWT